MPIDYVSQIFEKFCRNIRRLIAYPHVAIEIELFLQALFHSMSLKDRQLKLGILFSVLAALLICLVVAGAFVGALISVDLAETVAVIFVLAMFSMVISLSMFLREIYLAVSSGSHKIR